MVGLNLYVVRRLGVLFFFMMGIWLVMFESGFYIVGSFIIGVFKGMKLVEVVIVNGLREDGVIVGLEWM